MNTAARVVQRHRWLQPIQARGSRLPSDNVESNECRDCLWRLDPCHAQLLPDQRQDPFLILQDDILVFLDVIKRVLIFLDDLLVLLDGGLIGEDRLLVVQNHFLVCKNFLVWHL
jgi:hypothetical protein